MKKTKIRHIKEGWTGTIEVEDEHQTFTASHRVGLQVNYVIYQDPHKPDGTYVEDPNVCSLDELEFIDRTTKGR
jgi:hypothetical protein